MTSSSGQPSALAGYLADHGFLPDGGDGTWYDRDTGHGIIRVVCELGEETQLISLAPASVCRYKVLFSPGTPPAVIIAALEAGLSSPAASRLRARQPSWPPSGEEGPGPGRTREGKA